MRLNLTALRNALILGSAPPDELIVAPLLTNWFAGAWEISLAPSFDHSGTLPQPPLPPVREHGAALGVLDELVVPFLLRPGGEGSFLLDSDEMAHPTFAGYYHTHPYPSDEFGRTTTGVAFSDADLAWLLSYDTPGLLLFAHSGRYLFLVCRTVDTPNAVPSETVQSQYQASYEKYKQTGADFAVCVFKAVLDVCALHHLALYVGKTEENRLTLYYAGKP